MHDPTAEGNAFFKCDFCLSPWSEERAMIEGHKGSLICCECLSAALVVFDEGKAPMENVEHCTMCLEERDQPGWTHETGEGVVCLRCVKQSATRLEKDPEFEWDRPV